MKLNFDFSPWISPVSGNIAFWQSFPDLPVNYTIEGDRENRPQPSSALIDIRLDIIDLRHAIDNLEQRPFPDLNATYILQQPSANLPNAQALNQLSNGLMKNNNGIIQIATPNQDYLTPNLPSGQLWIGNNNNIATPQQTITIDNLPSLGTTDVPNPFTGGFVGQVWEGTASGRPEASSIVGEMFADIAILNAKFLAGHFVMNSGLTASFPAAQFLNALTAGALVQTSALGDGKLVSVVVQQDQVLMGGMNNTPESRQTIGVANLPSLTNGRVWQGDAANRPTEVQLNLAPNDATYIIKTPNANLPQAQVLSELGIGMAKIVAGGAFAIAVAGEDYATLQQLQEIEQQCQQYAEQAATSAEEAATSAGEAATSAGEAAASAAEATGAAAEATGAAAAASGSATAAGLSAAGAAASAVAAGLSAGSASSSASDASSSASDASHSASNAGQSATNAANSATQAQTYLNTLLTTGLTLQGDVNGSGLLSSPIVTTFKPNPIFTGNQSMTMPSGNSSQRPTTLIPGMIRFNTAL